MEYSFWWQIDSDEDVAYCNAENYEKLLADKDETVGEYRKRTPYVRNMIALHRTPYGVSFFERDRLIALTWREAKNRRIITRNMHATGGCYGA